jgi:imidazolonepropionase-like amidohydrolase
MPARSTGTVAVRGGYLHPITRRAVRGGTVLVEDGVISAVGRDVRVPRGTPVVSAAGKWVLPGFVEAHGHVGVHEEADAWAGNDTNERTDPNGARLRALDGINPADEATRRARRADRRPSSAVVRTDRQPDRGD